LKQTRQGENLILYIIGQLAEFGFELLGQLDDPGRISNMVSGTYDVKIISVERTGANRIYRRAA